MKRVKFLILAFALLLLSVQSSAEVLKVDKIEVKSGESFKISVIGEDFEDIVGIDIKFQYNPDVLSLEGYEVGEDIKYFYKADNLQPGNARIMIICEDGINLKSFILLNLTMRATGSPGDFTGIEVSASLSDSSFNLIHPEVFSGEVRIVDGEVFSPPVSSGGGGSSSSPKPEETERPESTPVEDEFFTFSLPVDERGYLLENLDISSENDDLILRISEGTRVTLNGEVIKKITVKPAEEIPETDENIILIGEVYELGPDGTRFDPPVTLIMRYDPESLPEGLQERSLFIGRYNEEEMTWEELQTGFEEDGFLIAYVDHFTKFAILGKLSFQISETENLEDTPEVIHTVEVPGFQIGLGIAAFLIIFQIIRRTSKGD